MPDPRSRYGRRYPLGALLALVVAAMVCGARSQAAVAQWGRDNQDWLAAALGFARGKTPCRATLHLLLKRLDCAAFERVLGTWLQEQGIRAGEALAGDGKTLRGIHGEELPGVHLVAAYAHQSGVVVGQGAARGKGHELEAVKALLAQLPLAGRVVTGDAQFAQRDLSEQVVAKKGTTSGWSRACPEQSEGTTSRH